MLWDSDRQKKLSVSVQKSARSRQRECPPALCPPPPDQGKGRHHSANTTSSFSGPRTEASAYTKCKKCCCCWATFNFLITLQGTCRNQTSVFRSKVHLSSLCAFTGCYNLLNAPRGSTCVAALCIMR